MNPTVIVKAINVIIKNLPKMKPWEVGPAIAQAWKLVRQLKPGARSLNLMAKIYTASKKFLG